MSLNTSMLRRSLWRLSGYITYEKLCDKEWIIAPASVTYTKPALYLPGATDNVTASHPYSNLKLEMHRIKGGRGEHGATIARVLSDVEVCGGYIYKKAAKIQISAKKEYLFLEKQIFEFKDTAVVGCSLYEYIYFGHWMTEGVPLLMAARELGSPIRNTDELTIHQMEYLSMLEMTYDRFIAGRIRNLIILEDYGHNNYKRERFKKIRERFHALYPKSTHPGAMIFRGKSGNNLLASGHSRVLINEEEIAVYLQSIGFKIIDPSKQSAKEIAENISGARIVISNEGSHTPHGLYPMANNGTLVNILPPFHFNNVLKSETDCMDLNYAFLVGDACEGGFRVPMDTLKKTLDLVTENNP